MKVQIISWVSAQAIKFICTMVSLIQWAKPLGMHSSKLEGWMGYVPLILVALPCSLFFVVDAVPAARDLAQVWKLRLTVVMALTAASIDVPMLFSEYVMTDTANIISKWSIYGVPQMSAFMVCSLMVDTLWKQRGGVYPPATLLRLLAASVTLGLAHRAWIAVVAGQPALGSAMSLVCRAVFLLLLVPSLNQPILQARPSSRELHPCNTWLSILMMTAVYCAFPLTSLGAFETVRGMAQ